MRNRRGETMVAVMDALPGSPGQDTARREGGQSPPGGTRGRDRHAAELRNVRQDAAALSPARCMLYAEEGRLVAMTDMPARRRRPTDPARCAAEDGLVEGDAFDLWLRATLRQAFDTIAAEPVPEDLLRMIAEDRAERERLRRKRRGEAAE